MYTIVMNDYKRLVTTKKLTIFQNENLADKIRFLLPQTYSGTDLTDFTVTLCLTTEGNVTSYEKLEREKDLYRGYMLCYHVPINSVLTKTAGEKEIHLVLTKKSESSSCTIHTHNTTINVSPVDANYRSTYIPSDTPTPNPGGSGGNGEEGYEVVEF